MESVYELRKAENGEQQKVHGHGHGHEYDHDRDGLDDVESGRLGRWSL